MYLVGAPHPHKADAQRLLENLISKRDCAEMTAKPSKPIPAKWPQSTQKLG
jgi:hypothetical protein